MVHKPQQRARRVNVFFKTKVSCSLSTDFIFVERDELSSTNFIY